MTSPGDTSSSSSNPTHPTTAATRRRSDSPDYPASKKRRRTFTADDRAQHRVIEKQRREALNEKFIDLARLLPNLAHVRRLSKGLIVDASIAHHKRQRAQRLLAAQEVRLLLEEREGLYKEVDALREKLKEPQADSASKRPELRPEIKQVLAVEEEVCGTFPAGFGDNGPEDGQEDGENGDSDMRGSRSPERDVLAKESRKAATTGSAGREGGEAGGSAGKEAQRSSTREAETASATEAVNIPRGREAVQSGRDAQPSLDDFAMDLSPSDIRILADDATRLREHNASSRLLADDAARMLEDDATRMLQDDPFMNPLAPTAALSDEDLLALLSADIALSLGDDRPSSIPQVYPDKTGVSPSAHTMSSSHGLTLSPHTQPFALSPPHSLGSPSDLSPGQIEELWRQLGSVEIPDLGAGGASSVPNGTHIPHGQGPNARTRAHGVRGTNGHVTRDANGRHVPTSHGGVRSPGFSAGLHTTDDLFGLTSHLSTTQVAGSMFGF